MVKNIPDPEARSTNALTSSVVSNAPSSCHVTVPSTTVPFAPSTVSGHVGWVVGQGVFWVRQIKIGLPNTGEMFFSAGNAAPISGARYAGDFVANTATALGKSLGFSCTAAGSPGTWAEVYVSHGLEATTTTNSTDQTVASFPVPANSANFWRFEIEGNKANTDDCVLAVIEMGIKRNGTGDPVRVGNDDVQIRKTSGLAISDAPASLGVFAAINPSTDAIDIKVSPGETVPLEWKVRLCR